MNLSKSCEQYFTAYKQLGNWKSNDNITNAALVLETISYATVAIPIIVFATYKIAKLVGRVEPRLEPSTVEIKTDKCFKKVYNYETINLLDLCNLEISEQQEVVNSIGSEDLKNFVDEIGIEAFFEKLKEADPEALKRMPLKIARTDFTAIKYALLSQSEFKDLKLSDLSKPITIWQLLNLKYQWQNNLQVFEKEGYEGNLSEIKFSSWNNYEFTNDQIQELIRDFGFNVIELISEDQILKFIANDENMKNIDENLYKILFGNTTCAKNRFSMLSKDRVKEFMQIHKGAPVNLFSTEQADNYFGSLKAEDVDESLYRKLFPQYGSDSAKRFPLLSDQEAANLMVKFKGSSMNFLSESQKLHYFGSLKAKDVDENLYSRLFPQYEYDSAKRFSLLSDQEAANLMVKFKGRPMELLSESQERHYFGSLKAEDVDESLYDKLFPQYRMDSAKRFSLLSDQEAANLMAKFKGIPLGFLSERQEMYYFKNLKAGDVDESLYSKLFPRYDSNKVRNRFQLLQNQEAADFAVKYKDNLINFFSEEQKKYYFGNLKAENVDFRLYQELFMTGNRSDSLMRMVLIGPEEGKKIVEKFGSKS